MDSGILYNECIRIDKVCQEQRKIFDAWALRKKHDDLYEMLAFDTETTGVTFGESSILHFGKTDITVPNITPFGMSFCIPYKERLALVWARLGTKLWDECVNFISVPGPKVMHNARYDMRVCAVNDIDLQGPLHCTLTMARIHWNRRTKFDLKDLTDIVAPELYGYEDELKAILKNIRSSYTRAGYPKNYVNYSFIPNDIISEYAMLDVFITWLLNFALMPFMRRDHKEVYEREIKTVKIVMGMELRGMQYDRFAAKREIRKLEKSIPGLEKKLTRLARKKFNPNSSQQLMEVCIENVGIPKKLLTVKGKITTAKAVLEKAVNKLSSKRATDFVDALLALRSHNKLVGTYLKPLYHRAKYNKGIVYCNLNPTDTRTGRMSCNNPNLQNIPRPTTGHEGISPVRKCFICRPGFVNVFIDYQQMEMWLFAILAKETRMLDALICGADIHGTVGVDIFGAEAFDKEGDSKLVLHGDDLVEANLAKEPRRKAKGVNFGIIYGMGFKSLAEFIRVPELEAYELRGEYLDKYPRIQEYVDDNKDLLRHQGYVQDIFGRRYNIPVREAYKSVNAMVQGSCAQIIKIALIGIQEYLDSLPSFSGKRVRMIMVIHDEIIFEFPLCMGVLQIRKVIRHCMHIMENIKQLTKMGITLKVDPSWSRKSWEDKHDVFKTRHKKVS